MKSFILLTGIFLLMACDGNVQSAVDIGEAEGIVFDHVKRISVNPEIDFEEGRPRMDAYVDTLFVVPLSNEHLVAEITKMRVHEDRIFIFDERAQAMTIFDLQGNFINAIDRKGKGPGEYVKIADFTLDTDAESILILDQFNRKILAYSFSGEFKSETKYGTHARYLGALADGNYIIYNDYNTRWKDVSYNLFITDYKGGVKSHMLPFDEIYRDSDRIKFNYLTAHDRLSFNFIGHYDNHVLEISKDSTWAKYYLDFGKVNIPEGVVHNSFTALDGYAFHLSDFYETERFFSFSYIYDRFRTIRYYDKVKDEIISWKIIPNSMIYMFANFPVNAKYGEYFVNYVDSEHFPEFINDPGDIPENDPYRHLLETFREINEEDNPVLFFFKMKSPAV